MTTIELRVGNWINEEPIGVRQWVNSDFVNYTGYDGRDENYISDKINPIPLSPEILEKAGFRVEFPKYEYAYKGIGEYRFLNISNDGRVVLKFMFNNSHNRFYTEHETKYVHQLQNLYFALCGTELNINL